MPSSRLNTPLRAAVAAFLAGAIAVTGFSVVVFGDPVDRAALGSLGYAVGGAIGVYIAFAGHAGNW